MAVIEPMAVWFSAALKDAEDEIDLEEEELSIYKQKKFGSDGDYLLQKKQLVQPIQDQIFNAIKEIAKSKNYDFIFYPSFTNRNFTIICI